MPVLVRVTLSTGDDAKRRAVTFTGLFIPFGLGCFFLVCLFWHSVPDGGTTEINKGLETVLVAPWDG